METRIQGHEQHWEKGKESEIDFWSEYLKTRGSEWPDDFIYRLNPESAVEPYIAECIDLVDAPEVRILDVGAGPLTVVGKRHAGRNLHIIAIDPLASYYDQLLAAQSIVPTVRTVLGEAEKLAVMFAENSFDIVHARNSIDHCYDAIKAVKSMLMVTKPGGFVLLSHFENEGITRSWEGLHQWNVAIKSGFFFVGDRERELNLSNEFATQAKVTCFMDSDRLVNVKMHKYMREGSFEVES